MKLHLHQFLSKTGLFKRKADIIKAVEDSEVKLDDIVITNPMYRFNPKKNSVFWKGKKLELMKDKVYYVLNKPTGYISTKLTATDKKLNKKTIFELIKIDDSIKNTLFAIGRLDEDTSGLIIITNDGKLNHKIANPKHDVTKVYHAKLERPLSADKIKKIESGVIIKLEVNGKISNYKTRSCSLKKITENEYEISINEGKKREVRRIFEAVGNKVVDLERVAIAGLLLKNLNLKQGKYKILDKDLLEKIIL